MTESGIVTCCGIWSFSMAEMNSLTDVVAMTYSPIMIVTTKRVRIPPQNSAKYESTTQKSTDDAAYKAGDQKDRCHPQRHQFLYGIDIRLPVVRPLCKISFVISEQRKIIAEDPRAEKPVREHRFLRVPVITTLKHQFRQKAGDRAGQKRSRPFSFLSSFISFPFLVTGLSHTAPAGAAWLCS